MKEFKYMSSSTICTYTGCKLSQAYKWARENGVERIDNYLTFVWTHTDYEKFQYYLLENGIIRGDND